MRNNNIAKKSLLKIIQYSIIAVTLFLSIHFGFSYFAEIIAYVAIIIALYYSFRLFSESNKKNRIQQNLSKFVSPKVMQKIEKEECCLLGGDKKEITILFADIRDFTSVAEGLEPDDVGGLLNVFFSTVAPIVEKYGGTVNKFLGDAFLAIFEQDTSSKSHAKNAVLCAYEILQKMKEFREYCAENNKPILRIGIGINTGVAYVGNIGTEHHMEYTVIGDAVNIASRIESHNKLYNTKLLISEYTYNQVKEMVDTIKISSVQVKGRVEPIDIYEVIDILKNNG